MDLRKPRGFQDFLEGDCLKFDFILDTLKELLNRFDFSRVDPPLLEYEHLFKRTLGLGSDIVSKEMYSFEKGEETLTLRPEGTASIARMLITNKAYKQLPLRWFYYGPMFRHERPQKGRFRQFHQLGVELLESTKTESQNNSIVQSTVEVLSLSHLIIEAFQLNSHVLLEINTLGNQEERAKYKEDFKKYLSAFKAQLSEDSQRRLESNPLRIWDSKAVQDQEILEKAPLLKESLGARSLEYYSKIKDSLDRLGIPFKENLKLVRGLDYYNDLVFEWTSSKLGSQSALIAGGRYDSLVEQLGGEPVSAVGWALGLERLSLLCPEALRKKTQITVVSGGGHENPSYKKAIQLVYQLRKNGLSVSYRFSSNFSKQMKRASEKSFWALIYGEKEQENQEFILKNLATAEQYRHSESDLIKKVKKTIDKKDKL